MSNHVINRSLKCGFSTILTKVLAPIRRSIVWSNCQTLRMSSKTIISSQEQISIDSEFEKLLNDNRYEELKANNWRPTGHKNEILLVLPRQKWGNKRMDLNYAKHLMSETISLINTLPDMRVIDSVMISTMDVTKRQLFGSGNLQLLKSRVQSNSRINGVVFSLDMLNSVQMSEMESQLGVDIFDRYSIVLNIFRLQAATKEAKLQIALAEIPYIRNNLRVLEKSGNTRQFNTFKGIEGFGQTWIEMRKILLKEREMKLKKLLNKIQSNREILRINRERKQFPVIAVVGYTNSGKTSLIKALTDDQRLVPKNQLFATLDVTFHAGRLPSGLKVLYTDTIGFISEIPLSLIHSFRTTLSEICSADLIVHVLDVSHPNHQLQEQTVHKTLDDIEVPQKLKDSIIEVSNKIDLVNDLISLPNKNLFISATKRTGLRELLAKIEESIIANTGRLEKVLRVSNGGPQYQWLYKNSAIRECSVDPKDNNFLIIKIYITIEAFEKLKHSFDESFTQIDS